MQNKMNKIINILIIETEKCLMKTAHASCIIDSKNNEIFAIGHNKPWNCIAGKVNRVTTHSEIDSLLKRIRSRKRRYLVFQKLQKDYELKGSSIVVIRYSRNTGLLQNSKPCENCLTIMKNVGIKHVYYSDSNGQIIKEKVQNIQSSYCSSGFNQEAKHLAISCK